MTLNDWFATQPRGAKAEMAEKLGVSRTWMGQVIHGRGTCSPELAVEIHRLTGGAVTREELRPDLFGAVR